jgi:signal transduction histidine kinase
MEELERRMEPVLLMAREVSHFLGTPLAVILSCTERLQKRQEKIPELAQPLRDIFEMSQRCVQLMRSLGTLGKISPVKKQALDVEVLFESVFKTIFSKEGPITTCSKEVFEKNPLIQANREELEDLLKILLSNSRDAMPHGGEIKFQVRNDERGPSIALHIQDSGGGIETETLSRICDPYFSSKERVSGQGMSLTRAFVVVRRHGGRMDIFSDIKGVETIITLPN